MEAGREPGSARKVRVLKDTDLGGASGFEDSGRGFYLVEISS